MIPALRGRLLSVEDAIAKYGDATAAVAVLLRERDGLEFLAMERATRASDPWSGHWSLPGGRRHDGESLFDAACRETEEEVGLDVRDSTLLGCMEARAPGNRPELLVLPFVFEWDRADPPKPGPETASAAWIPVAELMATRSSYTITFRDRERQLPAFVKGGRTIWGFTYRLLEDLLALLPSERGSRP